MAFRFLAIYENLYMIHRNLDLFYDIFNAINHRYQIQIHYLSFILLKFSDFLVKKNHNAFILLPNHNLFVITLWMNSTCIVSIFERKKVNCYCYLNFPLTLGLRSFIILIKTGLISLRYSSIDSVLFLSLLLLYLI